MTVPKSNPWEANDAEASTKKPAMRSNAVNEFMSTNFSAGDKTHRQHIMEALFLNAIDRRHRGQVRCAELLLAYDMGKPTETVNHTGEINHAHHTADPIQESLDRMIAEKAEAEAEGASKTQS